MYRCRFTKLVKICCNKASFFSYSRIILHRYPVLPFHIIQFPAQGCFNRHHLKDILAILKPVRISTFKDNTSWVYYVA